MYKFKAHPTKYNNINFRSRLEANWACFFDRIKWEWDYEPLDLLGWSPDFYVKFKCGSRECDSIHDLLVEVKPYTSIKQFQGHKCLEYACGLHTSSTEKNPILIPADSSAAFGINPSVSWWRFSAYCVSDNETIFSRFEMDTGFDKNIIMREWNLAKNEVQYLP